MQDNSQLFNAMILFDIYSSDAKQQRMINKFLAILDDAEDPTAMINYVETQGKHQGKSVLWLVLATTDDDFIARIINRADLSAANVNAVAMCDEDRGKSVLWLASSLHCIYLVKLLERPDLSSENINSIATNPEDLNKSPLWNATDLLRKVTKKEHFLKLLDLSNPTAINAVANDYRLTNVSVLLRAIDAIDSDHNHIYDRYHLCNKMLAKGANIEPEVLDVYQRQMQLDSAFFRHGYCNMQFTVKDLLSDDLQERIAKHKKEFAETRIKALDMGYRSLHDIIANLAFLIERPAQDGENVEIKSELINTMGLKIVSLVCEMVNENLELYADTPTADMLPALKNFWQMLYTREGSILINHLQNTTLANKGTKSLIDTCLLLSENMLPQAVEKEYILQALEVCFVAPSLDQDADIMGWRHFLATCYVQRDMPENAKESVKWQDSELQGSFAEVAQRLRNYELPKLPEHKKLRLMNG